MSAGPVTLGAVLLIVGGYVAGSMPWGYWMVRVFRHDDIRKHGSGNTGATNVWRTFGPRLGLPTLLLDIGKGAVPALLGRYWLDDDTIAVIAGAAAMVGHTFPVFLGLGGGKGVATATGVTFALAPYCGLVGAVGFVTVLWLFRYVSLASLTAAGTSLATCLILQLSWPVIAFSAFAAATVLLRHRTNLGRLLHGTEPRVRSFGRGRDPSGATRAG
jgi:acyl phosphate:glycerol-3-phosphate acyltransferase